MPISQAEQPVGDDVVILVDETGRELGSAEKVACHRGQGRLHKALTCLLFDDSDCLIFTRRAADKLLWPGFWDATVATHQRPGESDEEATQRRVREELGAEVTDLVAPTTIVYYAQYNPEWAERERCVVLLGRVKRALQPDPREIDRVEFVQRPRLADFITSHPTTPWFDLAWERLSGMSIELLIGW